MARGEAFLLQGGARAGDRVDVDAERIGGRLRTLLQMAVVLTYAASVPVVKVDRVAGPYETAATTLNLVRAFTSAGHADLHQVHEWNRGFVTDSPARRRFAALADGIERALRFMHACGADPKEVRTVEFFAGHECLLPAYERALTRTDARTGLPYATSGHLLWTDSGGPDDSHVPYLGGIRNPVAVRLGPETGPDAALAYLAGLDPGREPGRLTFLVRMGADRIRDRLPGLIEKVTAEGAAPAWVCDPLHGARDVDALLDEVRGFFEVHHALGTRPGGLHVELVGDDVPLELAFLVAEMMRGDPS